MVGVYKVAAASLPLIPLSARASGRDAASTFEAGTHHRGVRISGGLSDPALPHKDKFAGIIKTGSVM
jgi:hypothetical protein